MLLIIDSSTRYQGNNSNFTIALNPGITFRKFRLVFANVCNANDNTQLYYLVKIADMDASVRGAAQNICNGTLVIPVTSPPGSRNVHQAESDFHEISNGNDLHINDLNVSITYSNGTVAPDSGVNLIILELA
jgi:hypothetical protein